MQKWILAIVVLMSFSSQAQLLVVDEDIETLTCHFPGEVLFIQRSIPGVFPMMVEPDRQVADAAMVPGAPFTAFKMIFEGSDLIFRDTLPGGAVVDYFVDFQPAQDGKFFITMSEDAETVESAGAVGSMLSTDALMSGTSGYEAFGRQTEELSTLVVKHGVCQPMVNTERFISN